MNPWTVDADDIQLAEHFDQQLLHHTPGVDEFLDRDASKFFVVGTKGLGKTLLLKAQRIACQDGMKCLPRNALIDKPVGDKVFNREMITLYSGSTENWKKVWSTSIAPAVLKAVDGARDLAVGARLQSLIDDASLVSVMDHFVNILDFSRRDLFGAASDVDKRLMPRIRSIECPVAVFLDNIDEYFNKHILRLSPADVGELSPDVWYFSQLGLVEAAYQLRRINHHVKVYAAIRKEAFEKFGDSNPMVQQFRGSSVDMQYSQESLRAIFIANIQCEKPRNLTDKSRLDGDPFTAFLGLRSVRHAYTGEEEEIFAYIYRHTLGRPRDLMTIGGQLSQIPPAQRREETIKDRVNAGATEIAQEYISEISPYTQELELNAIFATLPRNVLTSRDIQVATRKYSRGLAKENGRSTVHDAFSFLFCAGLLGVVDTDRVRGQKVQRFVRPGQHNLNELQRLPSSPYYVVHPVLSELVSRVNNDYISDVDRVNIVGDGRLWKEATPQRLMCVLKADIKSFSQIMASNLELEVGRRFEQAVQTHATGFVWAKVEGGDSLTIIHDEPNAILKAVKRIMQDLHEAPGSPVLRVAIDRGGVTFSEPLMTGPPFRTAARLEPHVKPGEIWVTDNFCEALRDAFTFYKAVPVQVGSIDPDQQNILNIKKPGSTEDDELIRVFQVVENT